MEKNLDISFAISKIMAFCEFQKAFDNEGEWNECRISIRHGSQCQLIYWNIYDI